MTTRQLYINLGECVLEAITSRNQAVVYRNRKQHRTHDECQKKPTHKKPPTTAVDNNSFYQKGPEWVRASSHIIDVTDALIYSFQLRPRIPERYCPVQNRAFAIPGMFIMGEVAQAFKLEAVSRCAGGDRGFNNCITNHFQGFISASPTNP